MKRFAPLLFLLLLSACGGGEPIPEGAQYVQAEKGDSFKEPDVKDDFCGVHINFQYCKCAFHKEYCDAIGMDKSGANAYVAQQFGEYIADLLKTFSTKCSAMNGYVKNKTCYVCPEGTDIDGERCKVQEEESADEEMEEESGETQKENCGDVEGSWEKYSDIDFRIPMDERSYEAKMYAQTEDKIVATYAEQAELVYETALLRQQLADVRDYKAALVDNLRDNLVKATLRLTYVTYSQIKGAKGAGESFSKFLTSAESLEALGGGMKAVQAVIPSDSRLAIDTSNVGGKVKSMGWNATLEAIESMGDPSAIAKQVMNDAKGAIVPSADITPEEVEILRKQNLENNLLNEVIAELEAKISENETWLSTADVIIQDLEAESSEWLAKEKQRTLLMLEEECE